MPQQQEQAVAVEPLLKVVATALDRRPGILPSLLARRLQLATVHGPLLSHPDLAPMAQFAFAGADPFGDRDSPEKVLARVRRPSSAMAAAAPSTTSGNAPVFLDIGANVGACSLHMLLSTEATVLSFEPGPDNAFYASQSLLRLMHGSDGVQDRPAVSNIAGRALLVRTALGSQPSAEMLLHQAVGNAGHAVIGFKPTQYAPLGHVAAQKIIVRRLDDMLWPPSARAMGAAPPSIALLKMDVEG